MLDLKQIEKATEEDKAHLIDGWARLFKATTWREMRELADRNPIFSEAVRTAVVLSNDEKIRLQCEAREDYYRRVGWKDEEIVNLTYENQQQAQKIEKLTSDKQQLASDNRQLTSNNRQLTSENQKLTSDNQQQANEIERLRQLLKSAGISDTSAQEDHQNDLSIKI